MQSGSAVRLRAAAGREAEGGPNEGRERWCSPRHLGEKGSGDAAAKPAGHDGEEAVHLRSEGPKDTERDHGKSHAGREGPRAGASEAVVGTARLTRDVHVGVAACGRCTVDVEWSFVS